MGQIVQIVLIDGRVSKGMEGHKLRLFQLIFVQRMSDEKAIYWLTQVTGWFGYILLILFQNLLLGNVDLGILKVLFVNFVLGITISHGMRALIVHSGMLSMRILWILPRLIGLSILAGMISSFLYAAISDFFFSDVAPILTPPYGLLIELLFPFTTVYLFWNILYFAAIFLKNYEREEVKNLRLTHSMNEVELGNLRSQLNPHFMFNALNSIRALVDENPTQAKVSITQMSRMLRSSLVAGKRKLVPLREEVALVEDYLSLEKIRYEERLYFSIDVPDELGDIPVPPIILQTLVENGIKHGIAKLPRGGTIRVEAKRDVAGYITLSVSNSGTYEPEDANEVPSTSIGMTNSRRRLDLIYGPQASIFIGNKDGEVKCQIRLPVVLPNTNES